MLRSWYVEVWWLSHSGNPTNDSQPDPGVHFYSVPPTLTSPLRMWSLSGLNGTELLQELRKIGHTASRWRSTGIARAASSPLAAQDVWLRAKTGAMTFLCTAVVWSCCVNMVLPPSVWKMKEALKKGTSVNCISSKLGPTLQVSMRVDVKRRICLSSCRQADI